MMRSWMTSFGRGSVLVLVLASLCPFPAFSQAPADALNLALERHGGSAVASVQTLRIEGTVTEGRNTVPVVILADLDGYIRYDYATSIARTVVHRPEGEFEFRGRGASLFRQPHVGLFAGLDFLSIMGLKRNEVLAGRWTDLGQGSDSSRTIERRRVETAERRVAYGRSLKDEVEVRFDVTTGLVSSIRRNQFSNNSLDLAFPVIFAFSDYRETQGIAFPFRIEKYVGNRLVETLSVTTVVFNFPLPRTLFER